MTKRKADVANNRKKQDTVNDFIFNEYDEDTADMSAADLLDGMNGFVKSAIDLTKVIVEAEQSQNVKLNRQTILDIYEQSMNAVSVSIARMTSDCCNA